MDTSAGNQELVFDAALIKRYDQAGPRYTSYPTALQFHDQFDDSLYQRVVHDAQNDSVSSPLSLYIHLPFCATVCFYCACNKVVTKHRWRAKPYLQQLYREIEMQAALFDSKRTVDQLHWGGGSPNFLSLELMTELMDAIKQYFHLRDDDQGDYSVEIDPREVDQHTVQGMRELGFNRMSVGIQDFDPAVQKAVNRIQSFDQTASIIQAARQAEFKSINTDLIYGLPLQTYDSFTQTLDLVLQLSPDRISVFNYAHLPQRFKPQRRIKQSELPSAAEKLSIMQLAIEQLMHAGYVYIGMDHFAKPDDELATAQRHNNLHRNFQGYSTRPDCDLIGMGVSAIGKIGNSYSQNVKTLDAYQDSIESNRIPVSKGVELTFDDRLRRCVIERIICNFHLRKSDIENEFSIDFDQYFLPELKMLKQMQHDELLALDQNAITILPKGRLLVRNICMVFDRYVNQAMPESYSKAI
ncbi:MAG: oxygen-independent coproporphyrinogen III oxidase [Gammaproteobacteria bacterium]|nr:oxygen-independent coproporphyrinogen III oxidase [Gammaproteobacteria bacterium]